MKKWIYTPEAEERLKEFLYTVSPSSYELELAQVVRQRLQPLCDQVETDVMGNVYGLIHPDAPFRIALVAHMDEIGMQVTSVRPDGLLSFRKIGFVKPTELVGQSVCILGHKGLVYGVIGCDPLADNESEGGFTIRTDELWIDIGTESSNESLKQVSIGNYATLAPSWQRLGDHRLVAKGLDDKIGIFIMLETLKLLKEEGIFIGICAIGSVQEELQLRGIKPLSSTLVPDAALVIDVDYDTDISLGRQSKMGRLTSGNGVGLNINANNNIVLQRIVKEVAATHSLDVQETLGRNITGGTDAHALQLQGKGIACVNINIPNRYMHTAHEMCDIRDVETAVNLIYETILHIEREQQFSFRPGID